MTEKKESLKNYLNLTKPLHKIPGKTLATTVHLSRKKVRKN